MRDPFINYDSWLERPYQDMMDASDFFYDWCEENDVDPDHPKAQALFEQYLEESEEFFEEEDDYDEPEGWGEGDGW